MALRREAEMFQWLQHKSTQRRVSHDAAGQEVETRYEYKLEWHASTQDSSKFRYPEGHFNPHSSLFDELSGSARTFHASQVQLGRYRLSYALQRRLADHTGRWRDVTREAKESFHLPDWGFKAGYLYRPVDRRYERREAAPGDIRVRLAALDLRGERATFLGRATASGELRPWVSDHAHEFLFLRRGEHTVEEVLNTFETENNWTLYAMRFGSYVAMLVGFVLGGSFVHYVVSWVPLCGSCLELATALAAALLGSVLWALVFLVAYVVNRFEVALALLLALIGILAWARYSQHKRRTD